MFVPRQSVELMCSSLGVEALSVLVCHTHTLLHSSALVTVNTELWLVNSNQSWHTSAPGPPDQPWETSWIPPPSMRPWRGRWRQVWTWTMPPRQRTLPCPWQTCDQLGMHQRSPPLVPPSLWENWLRTWESDPPGTQRQVWSVLSPQISWHRNCCHHQRSRWLPHHHRAFWSSPELLV